MDCLAPLSNMKEQDLFDNLKTRELSVDQTLVLSLISQMTGSALKPLQICQDLLSLGQEGADALQTHLKGLSKRNNDGFLLFRKRATLLAKITCHVDSIAELAEAGTSLPFIMQRCMYLLGMIDEKTRWLLAPVELVTLTFYGL